MTDLAANVDGVDLRDRPEGEALPASAFRSSAVFEAELEHVFEKSWIHVADLPELQQPGDYVTARIGRVPVLVVRGHDGALRGFLNACRHRGAAIAEGAGNCGQTLRCPYHAWTYRTDGTLAGVPYREEFDCRADGRGLVAIRVATVGPFVFGCLDPATPAFEAWAGQLTGALDAVSAAQMKPAFQFVYDVPVHWKLYVENGLDGYHIPFVHDVLADLVAPAAGGAENVLEPHASYTLAPVSAALAQMVAAGGGPADPKIRFGLVFPNIIPVVTPGDVSYLRIDPVAPDRIRLVARSFDLDDEPARALRGFREQSFDRTNRQDIAIVTRVQEALAASARMPPGLHGRELEVRIGHFERLVLAALRKGTSELVTLRRAG